MVRFRNRQQGSRLPDVNLVPLMDVLMTVLTFFIIISMLLTSEQGVQVQLPNNPDTATPPSDLPDPLLVKLSTQGISLNDRPASREQLQQQMQTYLTGNTEGFVVLQAAPEVPYEQVIQLLGEMKDVGGDRVSLAIDE